MRYLLPILVIASALLTLVIGAASLDWPLVHDAPLMHYIAWRMLEGAVPYRDTFDMNLPGVYWLHAGLLKTLGGGDAAWRAFDLAFLAAGCGLLAAYGRKLGDAWSGAAAALLFALYHLAGGAADMGQRDYLLVPCLLLGAHGVASYWEHPERKAPLAWAGLAMGIALTLKPFAALFTALLACVVIARAGRARLWPALAAFGGAASAPVVLVYGWLAAVGGFGAFVELYAGYLKPFYGSLGAQSPLALAESFFMPYMAPLGRAVSRVGLAPTLAWAVVLGGLALALAALAMAVRERPTIRATLLLSGLLYGLAHYGLQGKGWAYHAYPLVAFACLAAAAVLRPGQMPLRLSLGLFVFLGAAGFWGAKGIAQPDAPWVQGKIAGVESLAARLQSLVPPGGRVQVMDTTNGGIHALYRLEIAQPTRFIYDFQFFHDMDTAPVQALRAEFVSALEASPPNALVMYRYSWLGGGYERLNDFPALKALLARDYTLLHEEAGIYRLYAPKPHS
jgi:hypothetical protein